MIVAEDFRLILQTKVNVGPAAASKAEILLLIDTLQTIGTGAAR